MIEIKDILSLVFSIIGIILVLYLTYFSTKWLSTKTSLANKSNYISIIDKIMLGQNKFIAIIKVHNKYYLISITDNNINILKELEEFQELPRENQHKPNNFNKILDKFKDMNNIKNNRNIGND